MYCVGEQYIVQINKTTVVKDSFGRHDYSLNFKLQWNITEAWYNS
jgi:hypothetical protein